uniref:Uncharacterized protein n=1 Tax=Arundo donax TaxID=35708 RepID=A0A0A9DXV2_ARUDO
MTHLDSFFPWIIDISLVRHKMGVSRAGCRW